jgi:phosphate transport system substrate-binding protein
MCIIGACSLTNALSAEKLKGSIQIKGSDTMVNLGQAWAEKFMEMHPDTSIAVTGGGSGTGIASLINGTCEIAETSREMEQKEIDQAKIKGIEPKQFTVALDGLAVVVNPKNPASNLTIQELKDIFTGKIANWKEVGGNDAKITILSREVNSGTHVYFKEHVLNKTEFAPTALLLPSSQAIADEVSGNPNAIGYYGMGYISPEQKAINVAKDKTSPYVDPTIESVKNGNYPISRPLFMYTKGEPEGLTKIFIDFVLSQEGQEIVTEIDFVPVK